MKIIIITLACLFIVSCAGNQTKPIGWEERLSQENPPEWTVKPTKFDDKEYKAFCGTSHNFSSDGEARDNATQNARKQIIDAIGTFGKHVVNEVISSIGTAGSILDPGVVRDDATELISEALVSSRASEFHIERWSRVEDGGRISYYYKAYVLVMWNNDDAQNAVAESIRRQAAKSKAQQDKRNVDRALEQMERLQSGDW